MEWTEVEIFTTTAGIEPVCMMLDDINTGGYAIEDSQDFEEFLNETSPKWDYVDESLMNLRSCESKVTVYLPKNAQGADNFRRITEGVEKIKAGDADGLFGRLAISCTGVREEDWENNWKQYFKPFNVGSRLLVLPSWEKCDVPDGRKVLIIDPGSSFGTGQHHTTRLCLERLEKIIKGGERVLDLGCGSGILSIAAMLLGAKEVTCVDIDHNAVAIAGENLKKNDFGGEQVRLLSGNIIDDEQLRRTVCDGKYDVVVANIVSDVLIAMSPIFPTLLDGGELICSGIIAPRADEVRRAVEAQGMRAIDSACCEDWNAISFVKADVQG